MLIGNNNINLEKYSSSLFLAEYMLTVLLAGKINIVLYIDQEMHIHVDNSNVGGGWFKNI